MSGATCSTCRWFVLPETVTYRISSDNEHPTDLTFHINPDRGTCHAAPPQATSRGSWGWPTLTPDSFCGAHETAVGVNVRKPS